MKIGILGPIWLNIPPKNYGGTEQVVYNLVQGLVTEGHDVTLFGPRTSHVPCKLISTVDFPLREKNIPWSDIAYHVLHITHAFETASKFDILHVHVNRDQDFISFPLAMHSPTPVLFTFHGLLPHQKEKPQAFSVLTKYKNFPFTSISQSQRAKLPLNFIQTTYNSINFEDYSYNNIPDEYFMWLGKVKPEKGTKEAILAAKKAGVKLIVAGTVERSLPRLIRYFEEEIKPRIDNKQIIWAGEVGLSQKNSFLSHAKALLNPISWEEPFGLVMVEAQATGTPVIAFNRGAAKEVIQNNKTGFLVTSLEQMVKKMKDIKKLNRQETRAFVEKKFSISAMIESYEKAYDHTIKNWSTYMKRYR